MLSCEKFSWYSTCIFLKSRIYCILVASSTSVVLNLTYSADDSMIGEQVLCLKRLFWLGFFFYKDVPIIFDVFLFRSSVPFPLLQFSAVSLTWNPAVDLPANLSPLYPEKPRTQKRARKFA